MILEKMSKKFFLSLSKNRLISSGAKKWGLKLGASQVVAGVTIDEVINVLTELNKEGLQCTVDHLGEYVQEREEAINSKDMCKKTIEAIAQHNISSHLSIKLTQLGLDIDRDFCLANMKEIVEVAKKHQIFIRLDMEDFARYEKTLYILEELRKDYDKIGTVIQAYLHRASEDVKSLAGVNLRLVKGAYKEAPNVAIQEKNKIDENYFELIKLHLLSGSYTAIASHDHQIIDKVKEFAKENRISNKQFEFQMLYGMRQELQKKLAKEGYTMRVYVPFGRDWYGYFMRRLAERPQNVKWAMKGLFSKS
ncbi:proline oxidase [Bacillus sp. TS-2]|nr:proline oxidase [Bacillus sp. TS-2]